MASNSEELTQSDLDMVQYFWKEKGDLTSWSSWEEKKPLFQKYFPELVAAWDSLQTAERTLDAVVDSLELERARKDD